MALQGEKFTNEGLRKTVANHLMKRLMANLKNEFPALTVVKDGRKSIYTASKLPFTEKKFENLQLSDQAKPKPYCCLVKEASPVVVNVNQLQVYLQEKLNCMPYDALQAMDIALRHTTSTGFVSAGRILYAPNDARISGKMPRSDLDTFKVYGQHKTTLF
uniref:Argonaute1 (AGO1) putative n=1 Tax=Albugo laibachii Nc14 TaxID=890382 RepID=F0WRM2_9STRA|nr:Argonaute1 (AGO1) putative [Albugo laibachii Nc14]|eukprot:CCA23986.1 Argonaute1 (AGO1) putative [Albugo laibachii Nc14]